MNEALKSARLYNKDGECLLNKVEIADTFRARLKGLLGRTLIEKDYGLLLVPCESIHMFFMKFPIDVFFLKDRNGSYEIASTARNVKPWRMALAPRGTDAVLETAPGAMSAARSGDILTII
ncbi:MAG: DUF192 domain-containing protein [Candidatus Omnitrophota bacterium]|nr:DUF192 domain-containing protein [Candidatus Omnitrophota bacterium]MBU2528336.1 DUF192 domain-containing protein [bacterium]MBU3930590.1 DUF192 domain-containing protein [bacterium]MBU4123050.1 DUF192 domain-containing protein [bacterium]